MILYTGRIHLHNRKHIFTYESVSRSVVPNFATHGLQPTRLFCPWDFPGKDTGMVCHFLLQGIFLTQGSNLGLPHCTQTLNCLSHHY